MYCHAVWWKSSQSGQATKCGRFWLDPVYTADSMVFKDTGDVAKWFKATDCKSVIRGFESPRLLQILTPDFAELSIVHRTGGIPVFD